MEAEKDIPEDEIEEIVEDEIEEFEENEEIEDDEDEVEIDVAFEKINKNEVIIVKNEDEYTMPRMTTAEYAQILAITTKRISDNNGATYAEHVTEFMSAYEKAIQEVMEFKSPYTIIRKISHNKVVELNVNDLLIPL